MTAIALHLIPASQVGTVTSPIITHLATSRMPESAWDLPTVTLTGVACGECSRDWRRDGHRGQVRHADVTAVRDCIGTRADIKAESKAEAALYRREQAYWDNGGPYAEAISRDADEDRRREFPW
jgi:hypothetical protein